MVKSTNFLRGKNNITNPKSTKDVHETKKNEVKIIKIELPASTLRHEIKFPALLSILLQDEVSMEKGYNKLLP